jgi:thiosulfate/3-mercaptopyruvate sulfurtransferase
MPHAINIPWQRLVDLSTRKFHSPEHLRILFHANGVELERPIITSCGSGVTASTLWVGLQLAGATNVRLYDGSWTEYAARPSSVIMHRVCREAVFDQLAPK